MRQLEYLSPSALATFERDCEEFYIKYLAETRAPRIPQERPAAAGSAFDACAKSALSEALFGKGADPRNEFEALFEQQVEPHNRDWALPEGKYIFECYKESGAYDDLLALLLKAATKPRFEFTVRAVIAGVNFLGKPDLQFTTETGVKVIHDWKLNGYVSKSATSPTKGYMLCRDGFKNRKLSKSHGKPHELFTPVDFGGLIIDAGYMEDISTSWADQLSLYGWSLGEKIGDEDVVLQIHQIVAKPMPEERPQLRVSEYRRRVRDSYQEHLAKRLQKAWSHITSGHVLHYLSREDNDNRCRMLEKESIGLQSDGSSKDNFFAECVRPKYRG